MGQFSALARFQYLQTRNQVREHGWGATALIVVFGLGVLVFAGALLAPTQLGASRSPAGVVHWGGWALEAAFYLGCVVAIVQSFRILEAFFRHRDARFLAPFPIRLRPLFGYRLLSALGETLAISLAASCFLLPVAFRGGGLYFLGGLGLLLVGVPIIVAVGFAAQMAAGVADYKRMPDFLGDLDQRTGGSGSAAAYVFSPAIALFISLLLLLFSKLAIGELFRVGDTEPVFRIPGITKMWLIIIVATVIGSLLWSYRNFTRHFPMLFARFFETDLVILDVGYDYFARDRKPARGLEARLSRVPRAVYRQYRLQTARRAPFARVLLILGPILALALYAGGEVAPWMVVGIGLLWLLTLNNPFSQIHHPALRPGMEQLLPVSHEAFISARWLVLAREILWISGPLALAGLVLASPEHISAALVAPPLGLSLIPLLDKVATANHHTPRLVGVPIACAVAGLTAFGPWAPWIAVGAALALSASLWRRLSSTFNNE